jgi:hypothetical protein
MIVLASPPTVVGEDQLDRDNPWPGLASYDERSHRFFSGRAAESDEALRRIVDEPVTVLFGKSGLGKTSLLNAGVFPRLRQRDMLPVVVRLHVRAASEPLIEQVCQRLIEEFRSNGVDHPLRTQAETLWEYLHRAGQEFWTRQNRLARPVFVFDQFEELFTLGRAAPAQVDAFREDLADLAENRIPAALVARGGALDGDVGLNTRAMPYKIVIALREDFLADLEGWRATMPSLRRNRMRLLPMRTDQALQAVCNERTSHLVSEPLGRKVVAFLSSGGSAEQAGEVAVADRTVEPALLSLFCRGINDQRKRRGKTTFDTELLEGAKETLVRDFYVGCLADQPDGVRRFIEEELVTESGFRNSYSVQDAVHGGAITESQLATLIDRHLLRHEHHLGADRVELTHDLLTSAVVQERERRLRAERARHDRRQRLKFGAAAAVFASIAVVFGLLWANATTAQEEAEASKIKADALRVEAEHAKETAERLESEAVDRLKDLQQTDAKRRSALDEARTERDRANSERDRANAETSRSRSRELAAHAEAAIGADPELAIALGLRAMALADTAEARSALLAAGRYAWPYANIAQVDLGGEPRAVALSSDGSRLVVLAGSSAISVWDVSVRKPVRLWAAIPASSKADDDNPAASVAFKPDESVIAVGRRKGIDLVDAQTGRVTTTLRQFTEVARDRRIVFSPDGAWLASTGPDSSTLLLANVDDEHAPADVIKTYHTIGGFAVLPDAKAIVTVGGSPLAAFKLSKRDGTWVEDIVDPMSCIERHSVSPGALYVSATWTMSACITRVDGTRSIARKLGDGATDDIVWSPGGAAFVELVAGAQGLDLVVGRRTAAQEIKSRIKGAHPIDDVSEKSRLLSVSEMGTRIALIDADDDHKLVRVYSVGGFKPFLSPIESGFAVAPHGRWIAIARPGVENTKQPAIIQVAPLEHAFSPDQLVHARVRIPVQQLPARLYATSDSIVAVTDKPATTLVFDALTGGLRFEPLVGAWRPLGSAGEMLLLTPGGGSPRIVRTVDGAQIEQWNPVPGVEEVLLVAPSSSERALAVYRRSPPRTGAVSATLYSIRRGSLSLIGRLTNLPRSWRDMAIAEDAQSLTFGGTVWHVTRGVRSAAPVTGAKTVAALMSPLGRFEIQQDVKNEENAEYRIIRRHDRSVIATARHYKFSDDDRWLATVRDDRFTVYDLSRGEAIFHVAESVDSDGITFAGQGILHVRLPEERTSMLIPLDWSLMQRFLRWLTPRTLTPGEECTFGLRGRQCWNELPVQHQKTKH